MKSLKEYLTFKKKKECRVIILIHNLIDKEVQWLLWPLNLMHHVLLCPKYRIKNNFIDPNGLLIKFLSLCTTLLVAFCFLYRIYDMSVNPLAKGRINAEYICSFFDFILFSIGSSINYTVNVLKSERNVSFVLKFQNVHRFINDKSQFRKLILRSWCGMLLASGFSVYINICSWSKLNLPIHDFLCGLACMIFDFNLVYAMRLISLLRYKVLLWDSKLQDLLNKVDHSNDDSFCEKMFESYVNILDCYDMYIVTYQRLIVFHTVEFFFHFLLKLKVVTDIFKHAELNKSNDLAVAWLTTSTLSTWVLKSLIFEVILSSYCEHFYMAVINVQSTCAHILTSNVTDAEKKLCKNVRRLHRVKFTKMNACGMFYVDATFPPTMLELITNYTIVLLQFAFYSNAFDVEQ